MLLAGSIVGALYHKP